MISPDVVYPITVRFEDGESEIYADQRDLEQNLEDFDSSVDKDCEVRDANGKPLFLRIKLLEVIELRLAESSMGDRP